MKKIPALNAGTLITGIACVFGACLASIALPTCASEPAPRCAVPNGEAIMTLTAASPPAVVAGAPAGANCSNWVPPPLQGLGSGAGCGTTGCVPIGATPVSIAVGLEPGFPDPNQASWAHTPYSMTIKDEYVGVRIQDYVTNIYVPEGGTAEAGNNLSDYPYSAPDAEPSPPPADPKNTNRPYSWGAFDTVFPSNGICTVTLTASKMVYPDVPAHVSGTGFGTSPPGYGGAQTDNNGNPIMCVMDTDCPTAGAGVCSGAAAAMGDAAAMPGTCVTPIADQPQTAISYEWANVKVLIDTNIGDIGGQIFADLTITQDSCTQSFHASILSPRAQCNGSMTVGDASITVGDYSQCSANSSSTPDNYPIVGDASLMSAIYGSGIFAGVKTACQQMYPAAADGGAPPVTDYECVPTRTSISSP